MRRSKWSVWRLLGGVFVALARLEGGEVWRQAEGWYATLGEGLRRGDAGQCKASLGQLSRLADVVAGRRRCG